MGRDTKLSAELEAEIRKPQEPAAWGAGYVPGQLATRATSRPSQIAYPWWGRRLWARGTTSAAC